MKRPICILTDRSRSVEYQRCHRARYLAYEFNRTGIASTRISIPLAVGGAVHVGLADLLKGSRVDHAVRAAQSALNETVSSRGLDVEALAEPCELRAELNYAYTENRALVEALVRTYAAIRLRDVLADFCVLHVEQELTRTLSKPALICPPEKTPQGFHSANEVPIIFMSRPDAVLMNKASNDIEILSFKTIGTWDARKQSEAEHDTQGLSESWAVEGWLQELWRRLHEHPASEPETLGIDVELFSMLKEYPYAPKVGTVRMEYLLRGERRQRADGTWTTHSPLIRGYRRQSGGIATEYAWSSYWTCSSPHPMRKSPWYPDGRCPGDGRRHKLPEDYEPFEVRENNEIGGVAGWIEMLRRGEVQPEAGDALRDQLVLLPPFFRHQKDIERWERQISAQEVQVAQDSWLANELLRAGRLDELEVLLDERFPMHTRACDYPVKCQFQDACWNPEVGRDPLASALFVPRQPHHELERERHNSLPRKAA